MFILDRPELKGLCGILRLVCRKWRDYLTFKGTDRREIVRTISLLKYSILSLSFDFEWGCEYAARGGHLKVLKWARDNGCPWDEWTCNNAAWGGHLKVLKWLIEKGCPWDEWTCNNAARGGHLEVLKWARENGCPE